MKNAFILSMWLAIIGITNAALTSNPYTFDTDGPMHGLDGWQVWCSGSGWSGWYGGNYNADASGGTCTIMVDPQTISWGNVFLFNHDTPIAQMGNPVAGTDSVELHFDVISGNAAKGIVKIEYFDEIPNGGNYIRGDEWAPTDLSTPGHYVFTSLAPIPAGTVAITPKIGIVMSGAGATLEIDNLWIGKKGTFGLNAVTLTIETEPNFINTTNPSVGPNEFYENDTIAVSAAAFPDCPDVWLFQNWQGDVVDPNSANTQVIMNADKTITAVYTMASRECGDLCHPILQGDINGDCYVNFDDFALYVDDWLGCTHPDCD